LFEGIILKKILYHNLTSFCGYIFLIVRIKKKINAMKNYSTKSIIANITLAIVLFSCSPSREEKSMSGDYNYAEDVVQSKMDSTSPNMLNSSAVIGATKDSSHVFMRNADIKFSVKDVSKATRNIEHIIRKYDGFITYTNLAGTKIKNNSIRVTEDSVTNVYNSNMWNEITLRVPNTNLDSALIEMDKLVDFLDSRTITADDVKLKLVAAQLNTRRNQKMLGKLDKTIDKQGKKLPETIDGLNTLDYTQLVQDEQHLNLLDLKDKVSYCTVKLYIYQPQTTTYETVMFPSEIKPYTPSFATKMGEAGNFGWYILQGILMFFVAIWSFVFVFLVIWFIAKWLIKTKFLSRVFNF
jgi:hypothetical protein